MFEARAEENSSAKASAKEATAVNVTPMIDVQIVMCNPRTSHTSNLLLAWEIELNNMFIHQKLEMVGVDGSHRNERRKT